MASPRTHSFTCTDHKGVNTKRFEVEGLIVLIWDFECEVTDIVSMVIEADDIGHALGIANERMDYVQIHTGSDDRKQYYFNIEQKD